MGASQSAAAVSGSGSAGRHVHRECDHRLKRVSSNEVRAPCMLCSKPVELGTIAYRCRGCGIVLHDACHHLPHKIKHFAHSGSGHQLTLSDTLKLPVGAAAAGRRHLSCNICAGSIDDVNFVYACSKCHGFYAHPNCCRLPQTVHNSSLHKHALTLLPPAPPQPRANGNGGHRHGRGGGGRICHNTAGNCRNAANGFDGDAWSYQCNLCGVEVCLACQLPDGGDPAVETATNGCGGGGKVVENLEVVGQQLATAAGTVLRALCCAWLGAPMPPPATAAAPTLASNPK